MKRFDCAPSNRRPARQPRQPPQPRLQSLCHGQRGPFSNSATQKEASRAPGQVKKATAALVSMWFERKKRVRKKPGRVDRDAGSRCTDPDPRVAKWLILWKPRVAASMGPESAPRDRRAT